MEVLFWGYYFIFIFRNASFLANICFVHIPWNFLQLCDMPGFHFTVVDICTKKESDCSGYMQDFASLHTRNKNNPRPKASMPAPHPPLPIHPFERDLAIRKNLHDKERQQGSISGV